MSEEENNHAPTLSCTRKDFAILSLGALGVVFGDIGTSPLYTIKESFNPAHGLALTPDNILGIISLIFWALTLVVTFKYLSVIFKADNRGEGGITALLALVIPKIKNGNRTRLGGTIIFLGLFATGLLYGEGIITPAISVLSALEGLRVATPAFEPLVVPLTVGILVVLFWVQRKGTAGIGAIFGPTMLLWFIALAAVGLPWIFRHPEILSAINPMYAIRFFMANGVRGFLVLSSVVLCITGAEALYTDIGHFGKGPIRFGWYAIVFPALLINYLGQGALVLEKGAAALEHPFYGVVPEFFHYPMVVLATFAAVIASQALISGAFSLTQQAVQLGYLPRTTIQHTSRKAEGQIFVPKINWLLMIACIALVITFRESSNLAAAYGLSVTGTMVITSCFFYSIARRLWNWSVLRAGSLFVLFLIVDLAFFSANTVKIIHGGWIPIVIALLVFSVMTTWKRGREYLSRTMIGSARSLTDFLEELDRVKPPRVPGTAVFMTLTRDIAPSVLLHHFKHNQALHERIILLSIITENIPDVSNLDRVRVTEFPQGFVKIVARYGYIETPDITEILELAEGAGLTIDRKRLSYYLGRETFVISGDCRMARWRKRLFVFLSRNARSAVEFFHLPPDRVIEIGTQIQI